LKNKGGDGDGDGDGDGNGDGDGDGDGDGFAGASGNLPCVSIDSRVDVHDGQPHRNALGIVWLPGGKWCTGTVLASNKVLTAASCVAPHRSDMVSFEPQAGIATTSPTPAPYPVVRISQGRDRDDREGYADWAILTLDGDLESDLGEQFFAMKCKAPNFSSGSFAVENAGYDGSVDPSDHPRPAFRTCSWSGVAADGKSPITRCGFLEGAVGGPNFLLSEGEAHVLGTNAGSDDALDCSDPSPMTANASNGSWFQHAPDGATGVALSHYYTGEPVAFATDVDWSRLVTRSSPLTGQWNPWEEHQVSFSGATRVSALVLEDGRLALYAMRDGKFSHSWEIYPKVWSSWNDTPLPVAARDISSSGQVGSRSFIYFLGEDDRVYESHKTGGSGSTWTAWASLGKHEGAVAIDAFIFKGQHRVVSAGPDGLRMAAGDENGFGPLTRLSPQLESASTVATGVRMSGYAIYLYADAQGALYIGHEDPNSSVTSWGTLDVELPPRAEGFLDLTIGTQGSGRLIVLAVGSDQNVYHLVENSDQTFTHSWKRFYK
jgi:hypothetical protein